eukprot:4143543-Prymnesium_polylepis.2
MGGRTSVPSAASLPSGAGSGATATDAGISAAGSRPVCSPSRSACASQLPQPVHLQSSEHWTPA